MTLPEKIRAIYPELIGVFMDDFGIHLQNDSDGKGDYIAKWDHPTLPRPTQDQLDGIKD